tara:strand:+ start:45 stop:278 length:234 start_codon:yes stop_codon:yes gene_type:complete
MDKIIKLNLELMIENIRKKHNISKSKLLKLSKKVKSTDNMNIENHQCNLPVYIDAKNRKYLLLSNIEDDVFYALLIK